MARRDHDEAIRSASRLALHRDAARERHEVDERGASACPRPLHDHQALAGISRLSAAVGAHQRVASSATTATANRRMSTGHHDVVTARPPRDPAGWSTSSSQAVRLRPEAEGADRDGRTMGQYLPHCWPGGRDDTFAQIFGFEGIIP